VIIWPEIPFPLPEHQILYPHILADEPGVRLQIWLQFLINYLALNDVSLPGLPVASISVKDVYVGVFFAGVFSKFDGCIWIKGRRLFRCGAGN
jgi:hypothetical protein